jgi:predicted small lipoprotein YifL
MHRRLCVAGLLALALAASVAGCGGAGETYCSPDDTSCDYSPIPVDTPTDSPTDSPPGPSGCIGPGDVALLYPYDKSSLSTYQNTMYLAISQNAQPGSFLAVGLVFTQPGQNIPVGTETGTTIQFAENIPSYVPHSNWDIYSSTNLPLPPNRAVIVTLVDTRTPAKCAGIRLATIDTTAQSVDRFPKAGDVRPSVSRVPALLRGGPI